MNLEFGIRNSEFNKRHRKKCGRINVFFPPCDFRLAAVIALVLLLCHGGLWAADTSDGATGSLSAHVDQESAAVGSVIGLTLQYRLPEGGRLPEKPVVKGLEDLRILDQAVDVDRIRILLLIDQIGPWRSAPIRLTYLDSKDQPQVLTADPISIQVVSNLGEKPQEAQLRPIQDIMPIESMWGRYLPWAAAVIAMGLTVLGIIWWYRRNRVRSISPQVIDPPHIRARKEIEHLDRQGFFEQGMVKKYYFVFSEILRRYLEAIRNFPAAEYTTEEIAQHITTEQDRKLLPLLQRADLVKFADRVPTPAGKEEDIKTALAYIHETSAPGQSVSETGTGREVQP